MPNKNTIHQGKPVISGYKSIILSGFVKKEIRSIVGLI